MRRKHTQAVEQYRSKWGLNGYRIQAFYNQLMLYDTTMIAVTGYEVWGFEVRSLSTLMKHAKKNVAFFVFETLPNEPTIRFNTYDELLHYTLTKKLAGL